MRILLAALFGLVLPLLAAAPVLADPYVDNARIDRLFAELAVADNETEADAISHRIWIEWFSPNDARLSTHMSVATNSLAEGLIDNTLDELNTIIAAYPDYAEGWNQRATLFYRLGRYDEALADVEKTLAIEPRHFGAMAGRVLIYLRQGRDLEALRQMRAALAIHPFLSERRFFPELVRKPAKA